MWLDDIVEGAGRAVVVVRNSERRGYERCEYYASWGHKISRQKKREGNKLEEGTGEHRYAGYREAGASSRLGLD